MSTRFRLALAQLIAGAGVGLFVAGGAFSIGGSCEQARFAGTALALSPLVFGCAVLPLRD